VAVASAGPYAPHPRQITKPASHHSVFTSQMPFLPPNRVKALKANYSRDVNMFC